jgi:hypothetical protein
MKYMLQVRFNGAEAVIPKLPADEQEKVTAEFIAIRNSSGVLDGNQLQAANAAVTVRVGDGQTQVTEGPAVDAGAELTPACSAARSCSTGSRRSSRSRTAGSLSTSAGRPPPGRQRGAKACCAFDRPDRMGPAAGGAAQLPVAGTIDLDADRGQGCSRSSTATAVQEAL